ncbi:Selenocysteine-specific elongation factor [compost metagenome]
MLRDQSAQRTLGGGRVLDPFAPARQRRTAGRLAQLAALREASLEQALPTLLAEAANGLDPQVLERQFNRPRARWSVPGEVVEIATRLGSRLLARERWQALGALLVEALARFHAEQPDELGPDRDRLRRYAFAALERPLFIALLEQALQTGAVAASGPWLHLPEHRVQLSDTDERLRVQIWPLLLEGGFDPPWVRELAAELHVEEGAMRQLLRKLARLALVQQVVKDLFYPQESLQQLARIVLQLEAQLGIIRVVDFRDRLGIGRKRCIQILEHFDRIGLTRRSGNERKVRRDNALAQAAQPAAA